MLLSDIFDQLSYGELSHLAVGSAEDGGIVLEDQKRLMPHINLGLIELHKRFPLRFDEVIIRQYEHIDTYVLNIKYAASNLKSEEPYKYLHDTKFEPFLNNVVKIERVWCEPGIEIPLNEEIDYGETEQYRPRIVPNIGEFDFYGQTAQTPTFNSIQILPHPVEENNLTVTYRAHPPKIPHEVVPEETEVDVPAGMLDALLYYVAARIFAGMGADNNTESSLYTAKFEEACKKAEKHYIFNKDNNTNIRLEKYGWV